MTEATHAQETVSDTGSITEIKLSDLRAVDIPNKVVFLDTDEILVDEETNIRFKPPAVSDIKSLAMDIVSTGQLQPVLVRKTHGGYILVDGFQRTKAIIYANENKLTKDPIRVAALVLDLSDTESFAASVSTFKRFGLSHMDYAGIVKQAHDVHGISFSDISKKLGHDKSWVGRVYSLNTLRPKIQRLIHEGKVSFTTAYESLVEASEEEQDKIIDSIINGGGNTSARNKARVAKKKKKAKPGEDVSAPLSLREVRGLVESLAGVNLGEDEEYKYSDKVQAVGKAFLKALDGKLGEKALANHIDRE